LLRGNRVLIIREVWLTNLKCLNLGAKEGLNLTNNWMKNIVSERLFLPTFFGCRKKVWSLGKDANRKTAWMQVSAAHNKCLVI
jgi:hypothetical protein